MKARIAILLLAIILPIASNAHDGVPEATSGFQQPMNDYVANGYEFNEWSSISGCYHPGFDYNGAGTSQDQDLDWDILSVADGLVVDIRNDTSFGLCMVIEHNYNGTTVFSQYGHLNSTLVSVGNTVEKGDHIAEMGNSGTSAQYAHLHWEIREADHDNPHNGAYWNTSSFQSQATVENWYEDPQAWCNNLGPYANYSCTYHTQDPNAAIPLYPGQTFTFTVSYKNTGNTDWKNIGGVSNPNYIELRSCDSSGGVVNSWLYPGTGSAPLWINSQRVVSPNATNVAQGQNAWFIFTGKVPDTAQSGTTKDIYFRPYHATGGLLDNWGGMHFRINVVPYYNIRPNIKARWDTSAELWKTYIVNMPVADRVTVFVTGEASYTCAGDDSDLRLKINGNFVSNWNGAKALDGAVLGPDTKTITTTHNFVQGNNTIQLYADRSPSVFNVLVVPYHPWLLCDMVKTIQAPGGNCYTWFTHHFYVHVADTYTFTIKGRAHHYAAGSDDDDARFILDGTACSGWNSGSSSLDGNSQRGAERTIHLSKSLGTGWRTLTVIADCKPKITAIHLERGNGSVLKSMIVDPGDVDLNEDEEGEVIPTQKLNLTVYPNPFNPVTEISYNLDAASHVELSIYDLAGRRVETIFSEQQGPGGHMVSWNAEHHASGVYFCRVKAGEKVETQKLTLMK